MLRVVKGIEDALELRDWLIRQPEVAIDTETTGVDVFARDFRVRLTQFGSKTEAWVFPTEGWEGFIDQLIRQYSGRIIMHNSRYDILALERVGVHVPWWQVDDTMIALRLAAPHQSAALKTACTTHVSAGAAASQSDLHKAMKKQGWDWATVPLDFRPYYFYAAMDTVLTARLADTRICREGFSSPMYGLEMDLREICSVMERGGMRVDLGFCQESNTTLRLECEHRIDKMLEEFGCEITSPTKLAKWLMTMGAKLRKRTAGGMPSTDRESLEMVLEDHPDTTDPIHVVASNALRVRDLTKLSSSYFDNFLGLHVDGLLHPSIETIAARTGRMSIRNPALQTLPRGDNPDAKMVRNAVIPRAEGQVLIGCDYEQIELRLMAAESGDPGLIEAFRAIDAGEVDVDFFTYTAREAFGDPDMAKSDPRRSTNKTLWYASCPTPDTLILCDDLVWRPAGDLTVGQGLIGFDEFKGDHPHPRARARRWRPAEVQHTDITKRPSVRIVLESGRELRCADDHFWLAQTKRSNSVDWKAAGDLIPGVDCLSRYTDTWTQDRSYEAGWLAGMFDGEGHLSGGRWNLTQNPGPIADQIEKYLAGLGISYSESSPPGRMVKRFYSTGGRLRDDMALLGSIQATRLIRKYPAQLDGKLMWRMPDDEGGRDMVVAVERIGDQPTITLQTSTRTYIAEGYGSHNSYGAGIAKMAASAGVGTDEMRETSKRVFRKYPGVKRLMKECEREAVENDNWIETPMGRRIWIDPAASYKALNGKIQGFAADLFKKAAVELGHAGLTDFCVVPVHDEMLFSIPEDIVEDVKPIIRETMTTVWKGVKLPADPSEPAKTWGAIPK